MRLTINGEPREVSATDIAALLSELDYAGSHLAVAVNFDVLPKSRWAQTPLRAGDQIEIITPRQGG
ncbi:MAG: sulfur carrier protein ThiS [Xanthobacteraceae bacterium]